MRFMKEGVKLSPYPFLITLYVEDREPAFQCAGGRSLSLSTLPEHFTMTYALNKLYLLLFTSDKYQFLEHIGECLLLNMHFFM